MALAREKLGKKWVFLLFILSLMAGLVFLTSPSNLFVIILMNILVGSFFFFIFKLFLNNKIAFSLALPLFLLTTLLAVNLFDPLNIILAISLSIAVGLLLK
jgi:hypothetical protein